VELIDITRATGIRTTYTEPSGTSFWTVPEVGTSWYSRGTMWEVLNGNDVWVNVYSNPAPVNESQGYS
jgi:hypothetical protein